MPKKRKPTISQFDWSVKGWCEVFHSTWFIYGIWYFILTTGGTLSTWLWMYSYDMFVSVYGLSTTDILWVQLGYAVWNVINDLIAGIMSDWYNSKFGNRLILVIPFNILWSLCVALPYYDIGIDYRLHYFLSISLFDGFLSFCSIITAAVFIDELSSNENERIKLFLITKPISSAFGFTMTYTSYSHWDKDDLSAFYVVLWISFGISVFLTFIAYFALTYYINKNKNNPRQIRVPTLEEEIMAAQIDQAQTDKFEVMQDDPDNERDPDYLQQKKSSGATDIDLNQMSLGSLVMTNLETKQITAAQTQITKQTDDKEKAGEVALLPNNNTNDANDTDQKGKFSVMSFLKMVIPQKNLWWFIIPSVINEAQGIFMGQFRVIWTDAFFNGYPTYVRAGYMSSFSFWPLFIELAMLFGAIKIGSTIFAKIGILIRVFAALCGAAVLLICIFLGDMTDEWNDWLAFFCAIYMIVIQMGYVFFITFFVVIMGNLVEEAKANRIARGLPVYASMTSMYWALHACFAKPFNGLGTIIGTWVLENNGYNDGNDDDEFNFSDLNKKTQVRLQWANFHLLVWFMLITSGIQYIAFRNYNLDGRKLANVQAILKQYNDDKKKKKLDPYGSTADQDQYVE